MILCAFFGSSAFAETSESTLSAEPLEMGIYASGLGDLTPTATSLTVAVDLTNDLRWVNAIGMGTDTWGVGSGLRLRLLSKSDRIRPYVGIGGGWLQRNALTSLFNLQGGLYAVASLGIEWTLPGGLYLALAGNGYTAQTSMAVLPSFSAGMFF